ncbi:MAG TPA: sigma-70 family RNA polymerase sigma factor [Planctomycetota bacterium]|nr:sigma-70 family RNA polymerase sigma factor [Planctomycetota bacterium]
MSEPSLSTLLERHRDALRAIVTRRGSGLLRFESADDLVQGVQIRALEGRAHFAYRGERAFTGWLARIAAQHIAHRHKHWRALRRGAGRVVRLGASESLRIEGGAGAPEPAVSATGPPTAAFRREQVEVATQALAMLFPRDRDLVAWISEDVSVEEIGRRLGLSPEAAKKARLRALERFRKTFELVTRAAARAKSAK